MKKEQSKIIYATPSPLTKRWLENYCLDELNNILDIEFWDCSQITTPSFKTQKVLSRPYVTIIKSLDDLKKKLDITPKNAVKVIDIQKDSHNFPIHRLLSKHSNLCIYVHCFGATEMMDVINPNKLRLKKLISKEALRLIRNKMKWLAEEKPFEKIYKRMYDDYWITSVRADRYPYRINHPDYERYRKSLKEPIIWSGERYVVYIDNNFPIHPEIKARDTLLDIDKVAPQFYASLNTFFTRIEQKYSCKVKIAGHPIAQYKSNPYGGREIIYDKTVELVKESLAVCIHTSNAFSYVVLFDKPVALIYNAAYRQAKVEYNRLKGESHRLRLPLVNTDDPIPDEGSVFTHLDKSIAEAYKSIYLIADPKETNAQLYVKLFRQIAQGRAAEAEHGNTPFASMVSVIIPVYNVAPYLRRCLDSVLAQMFKNFEVILIDDGSTDGSGAICDEYARKDPRFRVTHKENGGVSSARNEGIRQARGEWIAFVDSDDAVSPDYLSTFVCLQMKHGADLVVTSADFVMPEGDHHPAPLSPKWYTRDSRHQCVVYLREKGYFGFLWNKFFATSKIRDNGVAFRDIWSYEDELFVMEYMKYATRIVISGKVTYIYINKKEETASRKYIPLDMHLRIADDLYKAGEDILEKKNKNWRAHLDDAYAQHLAESIYRLYWKNNHFTAQERLNIIKKVISKAEEKGLTKLTLKRIKRAGIIPCRDPRLIDLAGNLNRYNIIRRAIEFAKHLIKTATNHEQKK